MEETTITITAADYAKLSRIVTIDGIRRDACGRADALQTELARAEIVASHDVPPDVITMNSRAELLDLDTRERLEFTVVFPRRANSDDGKISVFAPIGTDMLGYRVGDIFEHREVSGSRRLKVVQIAFQPEAALTEAGS